MLLEIHGPSTEVGQTKGEVHRPPQGHPLKANRRGPVLRDRHLRQERVLRGQLLHRGHHLPGRLLHRGRHLPGQHLHRGLVLRDRRLRQRSQVLREDLQGN